LLATQMGAGKGVGGQFVEKVAPKLLKLGCQSSVGFVMTSIVSLVSGNP